MEQPISIPSAHDAEFWAAAKNGKLLLQRSMSTGSFQTYPRAHALGGCEHGLEWVESSGRGVVHTFSIVRRSFYPALEAPYVIVVVELEEGVKFTGHLVDCPPDDVRIDMPVEVTFHKLTDEIALPCFRPRAS